MQASRGRTSEYGPNRRDVKLAVYKCLYESSRNWEHLLPIRRADRPSQICRTNTTQLLQGSRIHTRRTGVTLIELLIVIGIAALRPVAIMRRWSAVWGTIYVLAAIAVPICRFPGEPAIFKAMMSDLRTLSAQQQIYYSSNHTYTNNLTELDMSLSEGVRLTLYGATSQGWAATAAHEALATGQNCGVYYGTPSGSPPTYTRTPGVVRCTGE
jgi:hypothetical protein